jgi:zinc transporter
MTDSDNNPFVHAYILDGKGGGREIGAQEVRNWQPEQGLLWVHLDVNSPAAQRWVHEESGVDEMAADALLAGESRPRAMVQDHELFVNLRGVNTNPGASAEDMVSIRIWLQAERIITSRRRMLLSVQDLRTAIAQSHGPATSGSFMVALIERLADRIGGVVDTIEDRIDDIEDRLVRADIQQLQSEVGIVKRQTASIRRYLAPQRDALHRLFGQSQLLSREENEDLREQSDRSTRYLEELELARERAVVAQEELMNRMAHAQNSRLYILSIVAAIFLPLSFLTGLLGMNVGGLPGTEDPSAFTISVIAMLAVGVLLLVVFKLKKWI